LTEMLVVIGIVVVWIAILLPALGAARRRSNTLVCASHLSEIGRAYFLYAGDNRELFPWASLNYTPLGGGQDVITWDDLIAKYLGEDLTDAEIASAYAPRPMLVFTCPEDYLQRVANLLAPANGQTIYPRSYGVSSCLTPNAQYVNFEGVGGATACGEPIPWDLFKKALCIKQSWVSAPSETLLAFDMPATTNCLGGFFAYAPRPYDQTVGFVGVNGLGKVGVHGRKWNYLFCDGHVEALEPQDTVQPSDSILDAFYGVNKAWTRNPWD